MKPSARSICPFVWLSPMLPQVWAAVLLADSLLRVPRVAPPQETGSITISGV